MDKNMNQFLVELLENSGQVSGAIYDMTKNYVNMRTDNTIGADDYFHCLANYEAASRGPTGEKTAKTVGDSKELFDYYLNQNLKGMPMDLAYKDYLHDKLVNEIGRQQAKSGLYLNSKDGCNLFRANGINDKF